MKKTKDKNPTELVRQARERELWPIARFLKETKLKRRLFGVDEADVWQKTQQLCQLYDDVLEGHRARNEVLEQKLLAMQARSPEEGTYGTQ